MEVDPPNARHIRWENLRNCGHSSDNFTAEELKWTIHTLRDDWLRGPGRSDLRRWALERLSLPDEPNMDQIQASVDRVRNDLVFLKQCFDVRGDDPLMETHASGSGAHEVNLTAIINRTTEVFHYVSKFLSYEHVAHTTLFNGGTDRGSFRLATYRREGMEGEAVDKLTAFQKLVLFILEQLAEKGYRRKGDSVYREIVTPEGHLSHAWEEHLTLHEFIQMCCCKEFAWNEWVSLTASKCGNADELARHLTRSVDAEFPELKVDRNVFSFENGIYMAEQDMFYPFDRKDDWDSIAQRQLDMNDEDQRIVDAARSENMDDVEPEHPNPCYRRECDFPTLSESVVYAPPRPPRRSDTAVTYFPTRFEYDPDAHPEDIETKEIDSLMAIQKLDKETQAWLYAMLGRCLYDVGKKDNWQVILFIKGIAGSGKSTIGAAMRNLYPPSMVGTLSSNAEEKFGLMSIFNKLLFMCLEVRKDWAIHQGDFQSMVTGEPVSVAIKNKATADGPWTVPGFLAGNEIGKWTDAAGSMRRRLFVIEFNECVPKETSNPNLLAEIQKNIGSFLRKINLSYLEKAHSFGRFDIWRPGILPAQIHQYCENVRMMVDGLESFLRDRRLESVRILTLQDAIQEGKAAAGEEVLMLFSEFRDKYVKYRSESGFPRIQLDEDHFRKVFNDHGIVKLNMQERYYKGGLKRGNWLIGVMLQDQDVEF